MPVPIFGPFDLGRRKRLLLCNYRTRNRRGCPDQLNAKLPPLEHTGEFTKVTNICSIRQFLQERHKSERASQYGTLPHKKMILRFNG